MTAMRLFAFPIIFLLAGHFAQAQDATADIKAAMEPLGRLVGTWEKQIKVKKSEWSPEAVTKAGTHTVTRILNDLHMQETGRDSDGLSFMGVYSYDILAKSYVWSQFQSNGHFAKMTGTWDAKSSTFTWRQDLGDGITLVSTVTLIGTDRTTARTLAKDKDGTMLLDIEVTATRVDPKKK